MEASLPDSSSGNFSLVPSYLGVTGQTISTTQHNGPLEDIAAAMTRRLMRDGRAPMLGNLQMNGYRATGAENAVDPQDYVTLAQAQALSGMFPGFMQVDTVTSAAAPNGWLYANGQSVLRESYPALWARVQSGNNLAATQGAKSHGQYGPGNGTTTFTLPNLYADDGYFIRPMASGRTIGSVQWHEVQSHNHSGNTSENGQHSHGYVAAGPNTTRDSGSSQQVPGPSFNANTSENGQHSHSLNINATGGSETRPKNIAYPVLIKT